MDHWGYLIGIGIQTLLFLAGGYGMVLRNDWSNNAMAAKVTEMQFELKKLAEVITTQAVQTTRIDNLGTQLTMLQRNVEDMRRGANWVKHTRGSVDGEYDGN